MIKLLFLILAILAVSVLGFRVQNKLEDNLLDQPDGSRLELQSCVWVPGIGWVCD